MLGNGFLFLGIFSIIGLIIGGPIIDKFNTRKTALTALLPLFLALLVLLFFNNYFSLLLYMSLLLLVLLATVILMEMMKIRKLVNFI